MGDSFLAYAKELYGEGKLKQAQDMAQLAEHMDEHCPGAKRYLVVYGVHAATLERIGRSGIDWYAVLGMKNHRKASTKSITRRFVFLKKTIGDIDSLTNNAGEEEACRLLDQAYEVLSDEKLRSEFDFQYTMSKREEEDLPLPPPPPPPAPPVKEATTPAAASVPAVEVSSKANHRAPEKLPPPPPPPPLKDSRSDCGYIPYVSFEVISHSSRLSPEKGWRRTTCRSSIPAVKVISKGYRRPPPSPQQWKDDDRRIRVSYRRRCRDVPDSSFRRSSWRHNGIW